MNGHDSRSDHVIEQTATGLPRAVRSVRHGVAVVLEREML